MSSSVQSRQTPTGYVRLAPELIRQLDDMGISIYLWDEKADRPILFHVANSDHRKATLERFLAERQDDVLVLSEDLSQAYDHLAESLAGLVVDDSIQPSDRFQVVQMAVSLEVERSLKEVGPGKYVELAAEVSGHISRLVCESDLLPSELFAIAKHDAQTFSHVTNVAGYVTMLAERLGITEIDELDEIAMGAMLHDIGKRSIPSAIIAKPGRLTDEEKAIIRNHPTMGFEELYSRTDITHAQRLMVYQHHEHIDGNGYPVRILGEEIHPWARMLAVVDVFDALTGSRPYRRSMSKRDAATFIEQRAGKQFDKEMALCWTSMINAS